MLMRSVTGAQNYLDAGIMHTAGFYDVLPQDRSWTGWSQNRQTKWGNLQFEVGRRASPGMTPHLPTSVGRVAQQSGLNTFMSMAGPAMSAYFMYRGWQGLDGDRSGAAGAYDALAWDISTMSGAARWGAVRQTRVGRQAGTVQHRYRSRNVLGNIGVFMGAGMGAALGQDLMGTPGAVIGGYTGGALGAAIVGGGGKLATTARIGVAAAVVGGATMVAKGAFSLVKTGYRRGAARHSIDTAGDLSAFMTKNAMTMRARSVDAMRNSHMNARSALGMEATFMHQDRNYFSNYR